MSSKSLLIYNARLVDGHTDSPGALLVTGGVIRSVFAGSFTDHITAAMLGAAVLSEENDAEKPELYDAGGLVVMPAFIDMHAHFRYPGQSEKEDLDSGLRAAAAGGFGSLVLMPNTNPVISDGGQACAVVREASARGLARVFQTVSITKGFSGTDTSALESLSAADVPVITEDGHDVSDAAVMFDAMKKAAVRGIIVSCHCEDPALAAAAKPLRARALELMRTYGVPAWGTATSAVCVPAAVDAEIDSCLTAANHFLVLAEDVATVRNLTLAREAGCHIHIAHCSTAASMNAVRLARLEGCVVSVEVTPHHLGLSGEKLPLLRALVNPPLRSESDRAALLEALADGTADVIATDHAPHTAADKAAGAPGFTGLETAFAVCHTTLVSGGVLSLSQLSALMSENPARLLGLSAGRLCAGYAADLVLDDPGRTWTADSTRFFSKGRATPFDGQRFTGRVIATWYEGRLVYTVPEDR